MIGRAVFSKISGRSAPVRVVAGLLAAGLAAAPAAAETSVNARYDISWLGFASIGTARLKLDVGSTAYKADLNASVLSARASASASGRVAGSRVLPNDFAVKISSGKRDHVIQMGMASGNVRRTRIEPEPKERKDRVPLTAAHRRAILDPLSAGLMPVPGGGPLGAASCDRTLPVFEGSERFDIVMSYARTETMTGVYKGEAVVCKVRYRPVAGHRRGSDDVAYFENGPRIEAWLVPVEGADVLIPIKASVQTKFGTIIVSADRYKVSGDRSAQVAR